MPEITDDSIQYLTRSYQLSSINLSDLPQLTDESIYQLSRSSSPHLHTIVLNHCKQLTDESILSLSSHCSKLQKIYLNVLVQLTAKSLRSLASLKEHLADMDLSWCRKAIDDDGVDFILKGLPKMKRMALWGCNLVTDIAVGRLLLRGIEVIGKDQFKPDI